MYAIFEAKGKQWRAEEGATLRLPSLDAEPGDEVTFDRVLLAGREDEVLVGRPVLADAAVRVEVVRHGKGDKIVVFKRKRRKGYRRKQGHRQRFTEVRIVELDLEEATAEAGVEPEVAREVASGAEEAGPAVEIDVTGAAEELAVEHGIDLTTIEGTGKDGRILKADVQAAIDEREQDEEE